MLKAIKFPFRKFSSLLGLSLMVITLFFYKPVYADSASIVGTDVSLVSTNLLKTESWTVTDGTRTGYYNQFIYHVSVQLDNNYVGYLLLSMNYSYYNEPQSGFRVDSSSVTRKVFINGDKAEFNFSITTWYSLDPLLRNTTNATPNVVIQEQGVTLLSKLDSIQQIIDILNDLYDSNDQIEGLLNNQLEQLELVVSNTTLANTYLDKISKIRDWNIPIESLPMVLYMLNNYEPEETGINDISYLNNYPIFVVPSQGVIFETYGANNGDFYFIFLASGNIASLNALKSAIGFSREDIEFTEYKYFARGRYWTNNTYYLIKAKLHTTTNDRFTIINIRDNNMRFIPIYFGRDINYRISTDFALTYELDNRLLLDLDKIANGTTQSNSSAAENESTNNSLVDSQNELFEQEDNFNENMNDSLEQIDTNFSFDSKFGSSFIRSSEWVKTQFDRMTGSTPFGSILGFSLLLGVGLLLIGKVLG